MKKFLESWGVYDLRTFFIIVAAGTAVSFGLITISILMSATHLAGWWG